MNFPGAANKILAAMAVTLSVLSPVIAAEIGLSREEVAGTSPPLTVAAVIISGQIVSGDAKKVAVFLSGMNRYDEGRQIRRMLIHSPGGLIGEAMEIGRMLRANGVEVFIPRVASCVSACVLILAGGKHRTIAGRVGIDNPHFIRAAGPGDDVPALLAESRQIMRDYFLTMGVAGDLADAMFSVPDGAVRFLSQDELLHYRLR